MATQESLDVIVDIGCGGGFKLLKHFRQKNTIGVEIEPTLSWLKKNYPDRLWVGPDQGGISCDMVICSDVIEHVDDPDRLMAFIKRLTPEKIIISTPDRSLIPCDQQGPPRNQSHIREWSFDEFRAYLDTHLKVLDHHVCTPEQYTQVAICSIK